MQPKTQSTFSRRLAVYLTGVAIGLVMLGLFSLAKRNAAQSQREEEAAPDAPASEPVGRLEEDR